MPQIINAYLSSALTFLLVCGPLYHTRAAGDQLWSVVHCWFICRSILAIAADADIDWWSAASVTKKPPFTLFTFCESKWMTINNGHFTKKPPLTCLTLFIFCESQWMMIKNGQQYTAARLIHWRVFVAAYFFQLLPMLPWLVTGRHN